MENQIEIEEINVIKNNDIEEQYIISVNKFIVLSVLSFGLYELWWIYKSWRFFQQKDKLDIMPAIRAILSIFFLISLFNRIKNFANTTGSKSSYSSVSLFIGIFLSNLLVLLPDPVWLLSTLNFVFFIPAFTALNYAKQNSKNLSVTIQADYNGRQIAVIIAGIILWALVLLGMTMVEV